jgi:hypothetical protein
MPAEELETGSADLSLDTSRSSFVRMEVRDASGATVALSNPVWLLRDQPPGGIPEARGA